MQLMRFLLSLSDALELASSELAQHQLRTAFISWKLGEAMKLPPSELQPVFVAALVHDIGALTPEDKISIHAGTYLQDLDRHCRWGEIVLRRVPGFERPALIVRRHHTLWQDSRESNETELGLQAQILFLADTVERAISREKHILLQDREILSRVMSGAGTEFDPKLVDVFRSLALSEIFWLDLVSPRLADGLMAQGLGGNRRIPPKIYPSLAELIRDIIDFRSRFTATHSVGVSAASGFLAKAAGLLPREIENIELAGALHDLGKMAVPNAIIEKTGKLTPYEFAIMRQHAYYTYSILQRIGFSRSVAECAGFHHEKLDGSGYPFHLKSSQISIGARIVAVADIFTALAEDRPYRPGAPEKVVMETLRTLAQSEAIDSHLVDLIGRSYDGLHDETRFRQRASWERYQEEFWIPQAA